MSSCCTRKRSKKDYLALPKAIGICVFALTILLGIEMGVFYAVGII